SNFDFTLNSPGRETHRRAAFEPTPQRSAPQSWSNYRCATSRAGREGAVPDTTRQISGNSVVADAQPGHRCIVATKSLPERQETLLLLRRYVEVLRFRLGRTLRPPMQRLSARSKRPAVALTHAAPRDGNPVLPNYGKSLE